MKRLLVVLVSLVAISSLGALASAGSSAEQETSTMHIYYNADKAHTVSIESDSGPTAVLQVPHGVLLGLRITGAGNPPMPEALALPQSFRGDIEIRARREDEITEDESRGARELMARAPVVLEVTDVVVRVAEDTGP